MAGRPKVENPRVRVSCSLPPGLKEKLEEKCNESGLTQSKIIEFALIKYLEEEKWKKILEMKNIF